MARVHRFSLIGGWCLLGLVACAGWQAHAGQRHRMDAYAEAARLRSELEQKPARDRTEAEYERVLNAYRAVYHRDPGSMHAAASVYAVGTLLTEYGQVFHDPKASRDATGQYEFLRKQYPGSSYRVLALLDEGEIEARDLHEDRAAQTKLKLFLKMYPHSAMANEARYALANLRRDDGQREAAAGPLRSRSSAAHSVEEAPPPAQRITSTQRAERAATEPMMRPAARAAAESERSVPAMPVRAVVEQAPALASFHGPLPLVTSIRHWSTPNYTRVAINLQQEVRYEASRETNPDRIDFDLYGARLSSRLNGRSSEIIDNGFLKQIHLTEERPGVAQIELNVSPVSDYYAFYLPDPPRLIIDVHGRAPGSEQTTQISSRVGYPNSSGHVVRTYAAPVERAAVPAHPVHPFGQAAQPVTAPVPSTQPVAAKVPGTRPAVAATRGMTRMTHRATAGRSSPQPAAESSLPAPLESMQPEVPGHPAAVPPLSATAPTMVRALGLKINRIVIDAGHGGHDSGAIGPNGLEEKTVALDVALRLGRLLKQRLGADVIYTRDTDRFIPLETRTAIANQDRADLFISVHVNSSPDTAARGVATYYLSFTSSADALQLAARENAVSNESIHQLSDLVKKIALSDKINESREFAEDVDRSLYGDLAPVNGPGFENRGVHKAPFVVLIGANMPSILAEISFISNSKSAHLLTEPSYRERIAEALYEGVAKYVGTLNGLRIAQNGSGANTSN